MLFETIEIKGKLNIRGFCIDAKKYSEQIINKIKEYFTVKNTSNENNIVTYYLYKEHKKYLIIPKFYANKNIDITLIIIDNNKIDNLKFICKKCDYKSKKIDISFDGKLRDYQQQCINHILNLFNSCINSPMGGLLKFSCGMGKTMTAIYLSHILKEKTLIVVGSTSLLDQWVERYKENSNAEIGIIQQNKFEIDKDICIATAQTINSRDYDADCFKEFGLVIYDEVHHFGSVTFSNVLMKTSAKYTIGLSATPVREDDMMYVVNWFIGDIIYELKKKFDYRILVKRIYFNSENILFKEKLKRYNGKMTPDSVKMLGNLTKHNIRNNIIINIIDVLKCKGRKIFVFSDRVEHLKILKEATDSIINSKNENHMYKTNYFIGKCKKMERVEASKYGDIIFATLKIAEEGIDISRLDTVIYALPIKQEKRLEQSSGRILRLEKYEDLINIPLVIDISDQLSLFSKWSNYREEYYTKENWFVQNYYFNDNNYFYQKNENQNEDPFKLIFNNIDDEKFIEENLIGCKNNEIIEKKEIDVMNLLYPKK